MALGADILQPPVSLPVSLQAYRQRLPVHLHVVAYPILGAGYTMNRIPAGRETGVTIAAIFLRSTGIGWEWNGFDPGRQD